MLATKYFGVGGAEAYTRMFTRAVAEDAETEVLSLLDGEVENRTAPGRYLGHLGSRSTPWTQVRFVTEALWRGRRYDLVVCSHVATAPLGMMLSRLFGIPYLVIGYGVDVWDDCGPLGRLALQRAARVIALSQFTARMVATVQGVPRERICVIYPAVESALLGLAEEETPRPPAGGPIVLLTVARLSAIERHKACDTVIRALPRVQADVGPVRYVIVGDGDDRPRLEALARDLGMSAAVTFAGPAQGADLAAHYRACDVFVMPSTYERRATGWMGEGFGIVYIEAAAFGRPVIAGQGGGAPEAVQDLSLIHI